MSHASTPSISIVVPCYNAGRYIDDIVPCLLTQTLMDIEIILVNDGSIDNTLEKLKVYQVKDPRVKIVDQENGGLSEARNAGIAVATGEYVWFVDADDFVFPEAAETMYREVAGRDYLICSFTRAVDRKEALNAKQQKVVTARKTADNLEEMKVNMPFATWIGTVWRCLYKRAVIEEHNLQFRFSRLSHEDTLWNYEFLSHCNSCANIDYQGYIYMDTPGSLGGRHDRNVTPEWLEVTKSMIENVIKKFELSLDSGYYAYLRRLYTVDMATMVTSGYHVDSSLPYKKRMDRWRYLSTNKFWHDANNFSFAIKFHRVIWLVWRLKIFYVFDLVLLLLTRIHDRRRYFA